MMVDGSLIILVVQLNSNESIKIMPPLIIEAPIDVVLDQVSAFIYEILAKKPIEYLGETFLLGHDEILITSGEGKLRKVP